MGTIMSDKDYGKFAGVTATKDGGVNVESKDRREGKWDENVGNLKSAVGGMVGSDNLKQSGEEQKSAGIAQQTVGQMKDFGEGLMDRAAGAANSAIGKLTGNKTSEAAGNAQKADGKAQQRSAEDDL